MMPFRSRLLTLALVALASTAAAAQDTHDLPELGSSAGVDMSPQEARQYGGEMLHQMRALDLVEEDPQLNRYINDLGYRLVSHTQFPKDMTFTFFVVRDNTINAFAAPGGYIGVNTGLLTATRDESELAGVMAHEIAHITQHHIQRAMEDMRKMSPLIALTMVGAVLASQGSHSGDAGPAVLVSGMGALSQRQINFTRKDEAEADRIGIGTLADAGFDPDGMGDFFSRMERLLRPGSGGIEVPELLQTHPVTSRRISEANERARMLKEQQTRNPRHVVGEQVSWENTVAPVPYLKADGKLDTRAAGADQATSQLNYRLMRERARVLDAGHQDNMVEYYAGNLKGDKHFDSVATRYGYALALTRANRADQAIKQLDPLLQAHPGNFTLRMARADALLHDGRREQALAEYADLHKAMPDDHAVAEAYADALLNNGKSDAASKAAALLRPMLDDDVDEPSLYRTYGRACNLSGQDVRAAEAYADATYLTGHASDALDQLKRLLDRKDLDYYQRARIQARIDYLMPIVLELRRRGIKPEQQGVG